MSGYCLRVISIEQSEEKLRILMKKEKTLISDRHYITSELKRELESLISAANTCQQNLDTEKIVRLRESNLIQKAARVSLLIEKLTVLDNVLKGDD